MAGDIIDALFEDEKYLAACIRSQLEIAIVVRAVELQGDVPRTEDVAGKPSHPLDQLTEAVLAWVDCPDYITHGVDQFARRGGDGGQGLPHLKIPPQCLAPRHL